MEDFKKVRRNVLLAVVLAFLVLMPLGAVITWLIGPQLPSELSPERIVVLVYLAQSFGPSTALSYLWYVWYAAQPSLVTFVQGFVIVLAIVIVVLVPLFYAVLPYLLEEKLESYQRYMRAGVFLMFVGGLIGIIVNAFDIIPSVSIADVLAPAPFDFWLVLLSFAASILVLTLSIALGYQKLAGRINATIALVVILGIIEALNYSPPESALIGGVFAIIGAVIHKLGHRKSTTTQQQKTAR